MGDRALINQSFGGRQSLLDGEAIQSSMGGVQNTQILATIRSVANRVSLPQTFDAGKTWSKAETQHVLFVAVNGQIKVMWPNYGSDQGGEQTPGAAATGTAQITYTDRATGNPVTVNMTDATGGTTALTAPNGDYFRAVAPIDALAGTRIYPRIRANFPSGIFYSQYKSDLVNGDRYEFGTSAPSALGTAPVQTFSDTWYGPCAILALSNQPVAGIVDDSRGDGIYDVPNTSRGDGGQFSRLFGEAGVAYVNVSSRGDRSQLWASNTSNAKRRALLVEGGATFLALGLGTNDNVQGRTAAQMEADNRTVVGYTGLPTILKALDPFTTNGITTPGAGAAARLVYNANYVRASVAYYDPPSALESPTTPGAWIADEAVSLNVGDGTSRLHESGVGNKCAAATATVTGVSIAVHGITPRAATVPAQVTGVSGSSPSQTSIVIAYTPTGGGHEYRLNGGAWTPMPSDKTVTGLVAGTLYGVEVRGFNAVGSGPASAVSNVTTQSAPLTTWDPATAVSGVALSEGNRRMTVASGSNLGVRSTSSRTTQIVYAEFEVVAVSDFTVGLCNSSANLSAWLANGNGIGIAQNGLVYSGGTSQGNGGVGTLAAGNILGIEFNKTTGKIEYSKNGTWGGTTFAVPAGAMFLAATVNGGTSLRIRTETSQFTYAPRSGVVPWG